MNTKTSWGEQEQAGNSAAKGETWAQRFTRVVLGFGALLLLAAVLGATYAALQNWLSEQDRYLVAQDATPLPVLEGTEATDEPAPSVTSLPPVGAPETTVAVATGPVAPEPAPTSEPAVYPKPVQIRIPSLGVTRSIIQAPRTRNRETGALTWNVDRLLRRGRPDLVGHLEGSANPGEAGNTILAGHNFGYGVNGVFVRLGQLKPGHKIRVVNKAGDAFIYVVVEVEQIKWRGNRSEQLAKHWKYLAFDGPERLTLMSCSGANYEPFPERVYVVAEPQAGSTANSP
jgi:LPXTG-site transpeptidase (sortase) family protein